MKKLTRVFSIVISLVLMLSIAVMPTSAAAVPTDAHVTFELEVQPVIGELDNKGAKSEDNGIYKAIVYLTSDVRLSSFQMDVTYDNTKFLPIMGAASGAKMWTRTATQGKLIASNRAGTMLDDKAYYADGSVETDPDSADFADYWGPSSSAATNYVYKFEYLKDGAASWTYTPANNTLEIGECTHEAIAEIYFKLIDGQSADGAVFGFGTGTGEGEFTKSVGFDSSPTQGKYFNMYDSLGINIHPASLVNTPSYTYTAAAKTIVSPYKEQIRFDKTADNKGYAGTFSYRYLAQISAEDFNATFKDTDTAIQKIKELGFIFLYQETGKTVEFDMNTAKALAESTEEVSGQYKKKTVSYLSTMDAGKYVFSCIVTNIADAEKTDGASVLAYIKYEGADGVDVYNYYNAAVSSTFEDAYNSNYDKAFPPVA